MGKVDYVENGMVTWHEMWDVHSLETVDYSREKKYFGVFPEGQLWENSIISSGE